MYTTNCPKCNKEMTAFDQCTTLVGYINTDGHNHDDNCVTRVYNCESCGNVLSVSKQNKCDREDCDWVGKKSCFCHKGTKVKEWPLKYV